MHAVLAATYTFDNPVHWAVFLGVLFLLTRRELRKRRESRTLLASEPEHRRALREAARNEQESQARWSNRR